MSESILTSITIDEFSPANQAEALRVLGPALREVFGDDSAEQKFRRNVEQYGSAAVCRDLDDKERDYFADRSRDRMPADERARHRLVFSALRAAARHMNVEREPVGYAIALAW